MIIEELRHLAPIVAAISLSIMGLLGGKQNYKCKACKNVFDLDHRCVGNESGETAHVEHWNNTLCQRLGRFLRKTLSFSKTEENHEASLKLLIYEYNIAARHKYFSG